MTHLFIAQSIVRAPDFRGITLRMAPVTETVITWLRNSYLSVTEAPHDIYY